MHDTTNRSQDKTVIRAPTQGAAQSNCLAKGYVLDNRYVIEAELGAGGFGITYLAKHRYLEWVAIKEYLPDGAAVRNAGSHVHVVSERYAKMYSWGLHRFLDEARLLTQFDHPNIVSVQDFFEANDTAYLVMNYVRGRSLQTEIDAGRVFDEEALRKISYSLLDALRCIHRAGLFHRDISPDNILLREEDDTPVLIDFGSARYAMRMHGAEQVKGAQGHTPTAIFKQGYSPIEQYEGTEQGPYTDIYALGATLYRAAFGTRPVDALKRSGELRLKKIDPLEPASEKGQGKFSKRFLKAIDAALLLEANQRPQTVDAWLDIFGQTTSGATPSDLGASPKSRWRNRGLVAGAVLAAAIAVIAYLAIESTPPTVEDVPALLSQADQQLAKEPLSAGGLAQAQNLYLQVLTLDRENAQALSGYRATNFLKQFADATEREDLNEAVALLDQAEQALRNAGVDPGVLASSRTRVKLLESQTSLRAAIRSQPLSPEAWPRISLLLDELAALEGGEPLAAAGKDGLRALKATAAAIRQNDFAAAWSQLADAEHGLSPLGIEELPVGRAEIQSLQTAWQAARDAEIERLLTTAERHLSTTPLTPQLLGQALSAYQEVLRLDAANARAGAGLTVSQSLQEVLAKLDKEEFATADQALATARSASKEAGLSDSALEDVGSQLATAHQTWSVAQARLSSKTLRTEAADRLLSAPFDTGALSQANRLFQEAGALSSPIAPLEADSGAASAGSELVQALQEAKQQIDSADFEGARARLKAAQTRILAARVGLGSTFFANAGGAIASAEVQWNLDQAAMALNQGPLDAKAQDDAQHYLTRVQALNPEEALVPGALRSVDALRKASSSRQSHDYPAAISSLRGAQQALVELGVSAKGIDSTEALLRTEGEHWAAQRRKQDIESKLSQALSLLQQHPFDSASWQKADALFGEVRAIEGGAEQADSAGRILAALQAAKAATDAARFDDAQAQIERAEAILASLGTGGLDEARGLIDAASRKRASEQQQRIADALASAARLLNAGVPTRELLQQTRQAYQAALDLDPNQPQAQAGMSVVDALEAFLHALQAHELDSAREHLAAAESATQSAGLSPALLQGASGLLSAKRDAWSADQAREQILALRGQAADLLSRDGLSQERLALAEQALQKATVLGKSHRALEPYTRQTASGLEIVILLRALMAELEQGQFDAASGTLSEIRQRLPEAELAPGVLDNASKLAVSAQIDWHLAEAARSLSRGLGILVSDVGLDTAEASYTLVKGLAPERTDIDSALQGITQLRQSAAARNRREYDEALALLDQAAAALSGVGVANDAFDPIRQRLTQERQLWKTLTLERDANRWTSEAIQAMDRAPFSDATWEEVESLAEKIAGVSPGDPRSLAVRAALEGVQQARAAIETERFAEARAHIEQAQSELGAIGVQYPLSNAVRELDAARSKALQTQLGIAQQALSKDPLSDADLVTAKAALERVLAFTPDHPFAQAGITAIDLIQRANAAMAATEFTKSATLLDDADSQLRPLETTDAPVPQLGDTLASARRRLAKQRPSPGEIYPIVGAALQAITSDPLGAEMLDSADKLLRNVLAMQADEPTALAGLQAIEQLRAADHALSVGAGAQARASLKQAQDLLSGIGLASAVLEPAWREVEAAKE